jgi:hypothetical protein
MPASKIDIKSRDISSSVDYCTWSATVAECCVEAEVPVTVTEKA